MSNTIKIKATAKIKTDKIKGKVSFEFDASEDDNIGTNLETAKTIVRKEMQTLEIVDVILKKVDTKGN